ADRAGDEGPRVRCLRVCISVRAVAPGLHMVGMDTGLHCRRLHLLLVSPDESHLQALLGISCGAPLVAEVQPWDRAAADVDRWLHGLRLLVVDVPRRILTLHGADDPGGQPALPVLDPHGDHPTYGAARMAAEYAITPSRASRVEWPLSR